MPPDAAAPAWSPARRVLFRFVFAYLVLYLLPFPLTVVPGVRAVEVAWGQLWGAVTRWLGSALFRIEVVYRETGSGDALHNYLQVLAFLLLAALAAATWTLLDRRRREYQRLDEGLRVYARFALAGFMISYGAYKVIKSQFPSPTLERLLQPIGDASPMGLLWTLNGLSPGYNLFTGGTEILGGLLLTARRTTLLGALVSAAGMAHVLVLNLSFDVPVKLFSAHLLALALFLIAPHGRRLARFFVLQRLVEPAPVVRLFPGRRLHRAALVLRAAFVLTVTGTALADSWRMSTSYGDLASRSRLHGIWTVEEFALDGEDRPPLVTDPERWRRVVFDRPGTLAVQLMEGAPQRFVLGLDEDARTITLVRRHQPGWAADLSYLEPEDGVLILEGNFDGRPMRARLRRVDAPRFLLLDRRFRWVNETPYNR